MCIRDSVGVPLPVVGSLIGAFIGPFAGAFLGEFSVHRDVRSDPTRAAWTSPQSVLSLHGYLRVRGDYQTPGIPVDADVPGALGSLGRKDATRLDLALSLIHI